MVSGIRTPKEQTWWEFRTAFQKYLPEAQFCVATEPNCNLWEIGRFRAFTQRTAERYDTGEDVFLVGHSLGGVLACAVQPLLTRTRVIGIATIHSPHTLLFGLLTRIFRAEQVSVPIISFQGLHDGLVWWGSKHPKALLHVRNNANHFHDLWQHPENAEMIVETIVREFILNKTTATP